MNPLLLGEKLQVCEFTPDLGEIGSQPILPALMWPLSHLPSVKELLNQFSGFFLRRNSFLCSYRFHVSMEGGEFRIFLCHHLEPPSLQTFNPLFLELPLKVERKYKLIQILKVCSIQHVNNFALVKFNKNVLKHFQWCTLRVIQI